MCMYPHEAGALRVNVEIIHGGVAKGQVLERNVLTAVSGDGSL